MKKNRFLLCGAAALLLSLAACAGPAGSGAASSLPGSVPAPSEPATEPTPIPAPTAPAATGPAETPAPAAVCVAYAEAAPAQEDIAYQDEAAPEQVYLTFTTDAAVADFRFLSLALLDIDENGAMTFDVQPLYEAETLTPEAPLTVGMTFAGLIPDRGIAYTDTDGSAKYFSVEMSGEDDSPILVPFEH